MESEETAEASDNTDEGNGSYKYRARVISIVNLIFILLLICFFVTILTLRLTGRHPRASNFTNEVVEKINKFNETGQLTEDQAWIIAIAISGAKARDEENQQVSRYVWVLIGATATSLLWEFIGALKLFLATAQNAQTLAAVRHAGFWKRWRGISVLFLLIFAAYFSYIVAVLTIFVIAIVFGSVFYFMSPFIQELKMAAKLIDPSINIETNLLHLTDCISWCI